MKKIIGSLLPILLLSACAEKKNDEFANSFSKAIEVIGRSGKNEGELRKVIAHYRGDSVKLKAACFLIEHLEAQFHYEGKGLSEKMKQFNIADSLSKTGQIITNKSWDSIQVKNKLASEDDFHKTRDIDQITSVFLIRNIDDAFKSWHYPWARSMDFATFCEYILPYKVMDELPDDWRSVCQRKYAWVLDSLKDCDDPRTACALINNRLKTEFDLGRHEIAKWTVNYSELSKVRTGTCDDAAQYVTYVMRAMGIPVVMDFCPHWANKNSGHEWNALIYNKKPLPFAACESNTGETKIEFTKDKWLRRKRAKIFRYAYHHQTDDLAGDITDIYANLTLHTKIFDVTKDYSGSSDLRIRVENNDQNAKYAYICIFNNLAWQPIYYGKIGFWGNVKFQDMGKNIVYIPAYIQDDKLISAGPPFEYTSGGEIKKIIADTSKRIRAVLVSKYPENRYEEDKANRVTQGEHYELFYWDKGWISLGRQKASGNTLAYDNVPDKALLWLRDLDKGFQERIFVYQENKQVWW